MVNKRNLEKVIEIGLPHGTHIYVQKIGDVEIIDDFVIKNVILVHIFKHNLLSVGKLLVDSRFEAVFKQQQCVIRSCLFGNVVAIVHKINGLFLLNVIASSNSISYPKSTNTTLVASSSSSNSSKSHNNSSKASKP